MSEQNRILWVDIETTGLDPRHNSILEIGVRVTDAQGHNIAERTSLVWTPHWRSALMQNEEVFEMHRASGLVDDLEDLDRRPERVRHTPMEVGATLNKWLGEEVLGWEAAGTLPMAGNSVHFDRSFISAYMPNLITFWHYRNLDISSMREACRLLSPGLFKQMPTPVKAHRPQPDIEESISLWGWLTDNFFWV